ncbi:unnamed protein product [Dovyalis caffra]|uniref:Uncharacterized protein n=1 Tax=Dovyalis caffra TaxID=77055 RepID=A0AAV1SA90_9ROSI|nr:unnamed protein product [Dovyalis caffra]
MGEDLKTKREGPQPRVTSHQRTQGIPICAKETPVEHGLSSLLEKPIFGELQLPELGGSGSFQQVIKHSLGEESCKTVLSRTMSL